MARKIRLEYAPGPLTTSWRGATRDIAAGRQENGGKSHLPVFNLPVLMILLSIPPVSLNVILSIASDGLAICSAGQYKKISWEHDDLINFTFICPLALDSLAL